VKGRKAALYLVMSLMNPQSSFEGSLGVGRSRQKKRGKGKEIYTKERNTLKRTEAHIATLQMGVGRSDEGEGKRSHILHSLMLHRLVEKFPKNYTIETLIRFSNWGNLEKQGGSLLNS